MSITLLAKAPVFTGAITVGTVQLYKDSNWSGPLFSISTSNNDYQPNQWHSLAGMPIQDNATWIAFCLPVGIVMTLTDNSVSLEPITQSPSSSSQAPPPLVGLKNAGKVVDLVGTGGARDGRSDEDQHERLHLCLPLASGRPQHGRDRAL